MAIGGNLGMKDKLIKRTDAGTTSKASKTSKAETKSKTASDVMGEKRAATSNTVKMTFYVKEDLLKRLYNFAYWDRHSVTDAFNIALADGLKGKNTKDKEQK